MLVICTKNESCDLRTVSSAARTYVRRFSGEPIEELLAHDTCNAWQLVYRAFKQMENGRRVILVCSTFAKGSNQTFVRLQRFFFEVTKTCCCLFPNLGIGIVEELQ